MRIGIIIKETGRSLSRYIYVNLLLMVQFIICLFLLITMLTFYIEIGDNESLTQIEKFDTEKWYTVRVDFDMSMSNVTEIAREGDGFVRARDFYREITRNELFRQISFRAGQGVYLDVALLDGRFGKGQYDDLLNSDGASSKEACYAELEDNGKAFTGAYLRSAQMNLAAFELLSPKIAEGEGFTGENTTLVSEESPMPVLLGHSYQGVFQVGDTFRLLLPVMATAEAFYNAKVVGFLEEDSWMPAYGGGVAEEILFLDDYILCPVGMDIQYVPEGQEERAKIVSGQYTDSLFYSCISLYPGVSYSQAIIRAHELSEQYDVYDLLFTSTSFGMELLKNETETTIAMITVLTGAMVCFTIFCLVSASLNKIQKNLRTYAVYLVNGSGLYPIIMPFLLEMFLLLLPCMGINFLLLRKKMYLSQNYMPFGAVIFMAVLIFCAMAVFITVKLKGMETEELMRRKE